MGHHRFRPVALAGRLLPLAGICPHVAQAGEEKAEPLGEVWASIPNAASGSIPGALKFGGNCITIKGGVLSSMQTLSNFKINDPKKGMLHF